MHFQTCKTSFAILTLTFKMGIPQGAALPNCIELVCSPYTSFQYFRFSPYKPKVLNAFTRGACFALVSFWMTFWSTLVRLTLLVGAFVLYLVPFLVNKKRVCSLLHLPKHMFYMLHLCCFITQQGDVPHRGRTRAIHAFMPDMHV